MGEQFSKSHTVRVAFFILYIYKDPSFYISLMKLNKLLKLSVWGILCCSCSSNENNSEDIDPNIIGSVYTENLYLKTQANVNFFGHKNLTEVTNVLYISSQLDDPIVDLSPLSSIEKVRGLLVTRNSKLKNLDGLENLKNFEFASIENNEVLENINALNINDDYTGSIGLVLLPNFNDYEIFQNIIELRSLSLYDLPLDNLSPFQNLKRINGNLSISNMRTLQNLNELNLEYLEGELSIHNNPALMNLDGLENINEVGAFGKIDIYVNPFLSDFCALEQIITNVNYADGYSVWGNAFNPTRQDLLDGNCN